jgi:hypothetical protein
MSKTRRDTPRDIEQALLSVAEQLYEQQQTKRDDDVAEAALAMSRLTSALWPGRWLVQPRRCVQR